MEKRITIFGTPDRNELEREVNDFLMGRNLKNNDIEIQYRISTLNEKNGIIYFSCMIIYKARGLY